MILSGGNLVSTIREKLYLHTVDVWLATLKIRTNK